MMLPVRPVLARLCRATSGRPDLIYGSPVRRRRRAATQLEGARVQIIDEVFRVEDLRRVGRRRWPPSPACRGAGPDAERLDDPQVGANGYLSTVERADGNNFDLVANPVQMDETADKLTSAPEHGQHTEEILLELGLDWDRSSPTKRRGPSSDLNGGRRAGRGRATSAGTGARRRVGCSPR